MAVCAAGKIGVGPGVNRRFFRNILGCPCNVRCSASLPEPCAARPCSSASCTRARQEALPNRRRREISRNGYNCRMPLIDQIQKDITDAMKARDEQRLSCLRMVKTALKNREIDKMAALDDKESQQVLST